MDAVAIKARYLRTVYDSSGNMTSGAFRINLYCLADGSVPHLPEGDKFRATTEFVAMGSGLPEEKDILYELVGFWGSSKRGREVQFKVKSFGLCDPEKISQIRGFLSGRGVGALSVTTAEAVIRSFGSSFFQTMANDPDRVRITCGLRKSEFDRIVASYQKLFELHELYKFLCEFGVSVEKAEKLMEECGHGVLQEIRKDPFTIYGKATGINFKLCSEIAVKHEIRVKNAVRVSCAIHSKLHECYQSGGLFMTENELLAGVYKDLSHYGTSFTVEDISHVLRQLEDCGKVIRTSQNCLYLPEAAAAEDELAEKIVAVLRYHEKNDDTRDITLNSAIEAAAATLPFKPEQKQLEAVKTCMTSGVSVITGGPGTGKSTVLDLVIKTYLRLDPNAAIALLAPSGKAAKRMKECTKRDAYTIHKYLRATGDIGADNTDGYRPIFPADLVVVDESSMCDLFVACALVKALPERAKLIFVGDVDQLPSVGPGNVLRSLIASDCIPTTALNVIHRQGQDSPIVANAAMINKGNVDIKWCEDFRFITAKSEEETGKLCMQAYLRECERVGVDNVAALTPYRRNKAYSSSVMAPQLQNVVNPRSAGWPFLPVLGRELRVNDRIMITKNLSSADLNNGDIGIVRDIGTSSIEKYGYRECVLAEFDGRRVLLEGSDLECIESSLCYTIHRSQGSEYKSVVIPLYSDQPKKEAFITRNLLYTAVTRAKQRVIIVGDPDTFYRAIRGNVLIPRNSLLGKKIRKCYGNTITIG